MMRTGHGCSLRSSAGAAACVLSMCFLPASQNPFEGNHGAVASKLSAKAGKQFFYEKTIACTAVRRSSASTHNGGTGAHLCADDKSKSFLLLFFKKEGLACYLTHQPRGATIKRLSPLLAALTLLAAAGTMPTQADLAKQAASRFPQPVRVGDLLHRAVLKPQENQDALGRVEHVVRGPDGVVRVVMSSGGLLGLGTHPIAVPVDAMVLVGQVMEVVGLTPQQLRALPAYKGGDGVELPDDAMIKVGLGKPSH